MEFVVYHKKEERASFFILVFTKSSFCGILYTQKVTDICGARRVGEDPLIIALEEAKHKLIAMRTTLSELGDSLRIPAQREKLAELEAQTFAPDFWNDQENSSKILQRVKQMQDTISSYEMLCARLEDALTLAEMAIEENDEDSLEEVESELHNTYPREVTSTQIGECVMRKLKKVDEVAYIRFVSVYRDFNDVDSFMKELNSLIEDPK